MEILLKWISKIKETPEKYGSIGSYGVWVCVSACVCYLQQPSAPREVWLSRLLSVSEVMLGSLGSVDMDETSLAEEEEEAG